MDAITGVVTATLPAWHVLYLCEVDARRKGQIANYYPDHLHVRHWPGEGSLAMEFIVKSSIKHLVHAISWRGRCRALHLFQKGRTCDEALNVYVIGVHNSHGDLQVDVLKDLAHLIRK